MNIHVLLKLLLKLMNIAIVAKKFAIPILIQICTGIVAFIIWVLKQRINHIQKQKLEKVKANLQKGTKKYESWIKKRTETMEEIMNLISDVNITHSKYLQSAPSSEPLEKRQKEAVNAIAKLMKYFDAKSHYFTVEECSIIVYIQDECEKLRMAMYRVIEEKLGPSEHFGPIWVHFTRDVQGKIEKLKEVFRKNHFETKKNKDEQ